MRQHLATVMITGIFIFMSVWSSCGPVDPAEAPSTAAVEIINSARSWTQQCSQSQTHCNAELIEFLSVLVYDDESRTGATNEGELIPLNNVEVEIQLINGGGLYYREDNWTDLLPLENPVIEKTDDRGLVEFVHRISVEPYRSDMDRDEVYIPCGVAQTFIVVASVGTSSAEIEYQFTCEEAEEEEDDE